ncbi:MULTISPECIES: spore germination protein [Bacillus]|uniref:Spore germination protein n=1 Tax=Bacillus paranthracis TaxID=2026186 RepID=A0AAJ1JZJ4_9BACI|nr:MULTISPECIES: spore germination protein [Bacillus]MDG0946596.1 spore germination protein [Bacillus paranthracis]MDG0951831.1 spore germination protein [Bacillus paranthracis]TNP27702.1 spore germination protein [Bacillus sp. CD3-5]
MSWWKSRDKQVKKNNIQSKTKQEYKPSQNTIVHFTNDFASNLELIKQQIGHNSDVRFRKFNIGRTDIQAGIVFVDGLSDKEIIDKHIMKLLMDDFSDEYKNESSYVEGTVSKEYIKNKVLTISEVAEVHYIKDLIPKVLIGSTALLIDGLADVFILGTTKANKRNIEEPVSEALVRGPRVGFTEVLSDNTSLLRRHCADENLSLVKLPVGERAKKELVVAFINDLASTELVDEIKNRIQKIDIDSVLESGYIEQLIEDNYLSPFPQIQNTERPDRVISALMEGRVAILLDGTPFVLIAPVTFSMLLQSPEDYYERWLPGTLLRLLRFMTAFVSLFAPALYISFISFHPGLIPTKLAISIIGSREGVPFPALIEALIMEIAIEVLREAGLRLPKPIGPAMGIVGGLIIGQAAVEAGIVSPIMVIVVAVTAISSFTIPQYSVGITLRILRFVAMFCAAIFGLYGVILFFLLLCSHLVKLKSFGVPYTSPAVPYRFSDWKDFMVRMPLKIMRRRPKIMHTKKTIRKR